MKQGIKTITILLIAVLLFTGCNMLAKRVPPEPIATVQTGIEEVKPEIEQQITQLSATLESMATQYAPTIETLATTVPATLESFLPENESSLYTGEMKVIETEDYLIKLPVALAENAYFMTEEESEDFGYFTPSHRTIHFEGYALSEHFHTPKIYIFPVDEYKTLNPFAEEEMNSLEEMLSDPDRDLQSEDYLPFLPPFNAAQIFRVLVGRLESENGRGIRYLTEYAQDYVAITNEHIFYTYQGFSADGRYYIAAVLPIHSSLLEGNENALPGTVASQEDYDNMVAREVEKILAQNGGLLTPAIEALDAMMMSITILK